MGSEGSWTTQSWRSTALIPGQAAGKLVASTCELSFWGGINPRTGEIIDRNHPLRGHFINDVVLAIPSGRGSCTGSAVMLELLLSGNAPVALIFARCEEILTLGVVIAEEIFGLSSIPVVTLEPQDFREVLQASFVRIDGDVVYALESECDFEPPQQGSRKPLPLLLSGRLNLTNRDQAYLDSQHGEAARSAMRIIVRTAIMQDAQQLIDISQVHVDGCIYTGPGSLAFAEKLRDLGGKVLVPTTLNSISIDQRYWRTYGRSGDYVAFGEASQKQAKAYTDMGAQPTFTCAPYLLDTAPKCGEQVAWAESNAVVYANSVLGAYTQKYPDFLDIAIALTGRAPYTGMHLSEKRLATLCVHVHGFDMDRIGDSFYSLVGYHIGGLARNKIPLITGLEKLKPSNDDLKAFSAAFGTVASAAMFHMAGITPEATSLEAVLDQTHEVTRVSVTPEELQRCRLELNSADVDEKVDLVSLGNPHFSLTEIRKLSRLCKDRVKLDGVYVMVTCGRATYSLAIQAGYAGQLETFGVQFINDTCWCMITEPVIPREVEVIMTNSAKYAHYGPGITEKRYLFGSLAECVDVASERLR